MPDSADGIVSRDDTDTQGPIQMVKREEGGTPHDFPKAILRLERRIGETRALASQIANVLVIEPVPQEQDESLIIHNEDGGQNEHSALQSYVKDLNTLSARLHAFNQGLDNALRELRNATGMVIKEPSGSSES